MTTYEDMNPHAVSTKQVKQFLKTKGFKVWVQAQNGSRFGYHMIYSEDYFRTDTKLIDLLNEYFYWVGGEIHGINKAFAYIKRSKTKKPLYS